MKLKKLILKLSKGKYCVTDKLKIEKIENGYLVNEVKYCLTLEDAFNHYKKILIEYFK